MRRKICRILYKLNLRRLAYFISPSVACYLDSKSISEMFIKGFNS